MGRNFVAWLVAFLGLGSAVYTGFVPEAKLASPYDFDGAKISPKFALLSDLEDINREPLNSEVERYHRVEERLAKHTKRTQSLPELGNAEQMPLGGGTRFIDAFLSDESVLHRLHLLRLSVIVPVVALASPQQAQVLSDRAGASEHWSAALRLSNVFRRVSSILATQHWDSERDRGVAAILGLTTLVGVLSAHEYFERLNAFFPGYGPWIANGADIAAGAAGVFAVAWELLWPKYMKRNLKKDWDSLKLDKRTSLRKLYSDETCELLLRSEPSRPLFHSIQHAN